MLQNRDLKFLNETVEIYASLMIEKMAYEGDEQFWGSIKADEIKKSTGRERLSPVIIQQYIDFLNAHGIAAVYNRDTQSLDMYIESVFGLNLGRQLAARAANALSEYRLYREFK